MLDFLQVLLDKGRAFSSISVWLECQAAMLALVMHQRDLTTVLELVLVFLQLAFSINEK